MEEIAQEILWIEIGLICSIMATVVAFLIRNAISKNATKENVQAKTDLLEKDIEYLKKGMDSLMEQQNSQSKRISAVHENSKDLYVSKELFHESIRQFQEKLDAILKFVKINNNRKS